jgi:hypothetical protein
VKTEKLLTCMLEARGAGCGVPVMLRCGIGYVSSYIAVIKLFKTYIVMWQNYVCVRNCNSFKADYRCSCNVVRVTAKAVLV